MCNDGYENDGVCWCDAGWSGPECSWCAFDYFGPNCDPCLCSPEHAGCNDGLSSDGSCVCAYSGMNRRAWPRFPRAPSATSSVGRVRCACARAGRDGPLDPWMFVVWRLLRPPWSNRSRGLSTVGPPPLRRTVGVVSACARTRAVRLHVPESMPSAPPALAAYRAPPCQGARIIITLGR